MRIDGRASLGGCPARRPDLYALRRLGRDLLPQIHREHAGLPRGGSVSREGVCVMRDEAGRHAGRPTSPPWRERSGAAGISAVLRDGGSRQPRRGKR
jgi:hypothetical protein